MFRNEGADEFFHRIKNPYLTLSSKPLRFSRLMSDVVSKTGIQQKTPAMVSESAVVLEHTNFQGDYRLIRFAAPRVGPLVKPGQFLHLKVPYVEDSLLRRPFSIYQADDSSVALLYKDIGKGTHAMTFIKPGEELNLIGPLGTGFPAPQPGRIPVLVAGGYGMAALYLLAKTSPSQGVAFFGGAKALDILCVAEFEALGWEVRVATEDGSLGTKGLVTVALDAWLEALGGETPEFFACGPNGMLQAVSDRAIARDHDAWVSVDRNMGCGVGACLTCVQKIVSGDGWSWARVCREGPVFAANTVIWDD